MSSYQSNVAKCLCDIFTVQFLFESNKKYFLSINQGIKTLKLRSCRLELFCKKGVLKNLAKFKEKHLYQSLFFNTVAGLTHKTYNFII